MEIEKLIHEFRYHFSRPLPGHKAQDKMAPSKRHYNENKKLRSKASVLILMYPRDNLLYLVLIKRQVYGGVHSGQVSLPGGKPEPGDKSMYETALRETREEIGIEPSTIYYLGKLTTLVIPISGFEVFPFVGLSSKTPVFFIESREVDHLIEIPVSLLFNKNYYKTKSFRKDKLTYSAPCIETGKDYIWGATLMILSEFTEAIHELANLHSEYFYNDQTD